MKKLYTLGLSLIISLVMMAQTSVTFQLNLADMAGTDGVFIAGDFNAGGDDYPEWNPSGIELFDEDMDNVWSVELMLSPGDYQFKYINGEGWNFSEVVPNACRVDGTENRGVTVGMMPLVLGPVCLSECGDCGTRTIVFRVDMSLSADGVNPNGVHVAGSFQGWDATSNELLDTDSDLIYTYTHNYVPVNPAVNDTLIFKYINDNAFSGFEENISGDCAQEGDTGNRQEIISENTTVLPAYCYNTCETCVSPTVVTFQVDMSLETVNANGVHIAGAFQGWDAGATTMTDTGSGVWEYTVELAPGDYQFKYINGNTWDNPNESLPGECNVGGNRSITVLEEASQEVLNCYNQCGSLCEVDPLPADITFSLDMNGLEAISPDGVWLIGGFTNPPWQGGATQMTDDNSDGIYIATLNAAGPANIQYKFVNGDVSVSENEENAGIELCGIANGIGGFNRTHARSGSNETLAIACFDQCDCESSVEETALLNSLNIYPNPATDRVNITFASERELTVKLVNSLGQIVYNQFAINDLVTISTSSLAAGLYTIQLENEAISVNKILIIQ